MMMNKTISILALTTLLVPPLVQAEEERTTRYPSELTPEEHSSMMLSAGKYDECLKQEAMKVVDDHDDFRKVADVAMENCKEVLTEIDADLAKMNLDPDYRQFFVRNTSRKSARDILPQLMMMKSK